MIGLGPCHRCGSRLEGYEAVSTIDPKWNVWTHRCPKCGPLCSGHDRALEPHPSDGLPRCPDCAEGKPLPMMDPRAALEAEAKRIAQDDALALLRSEEEALATAICAAAESYAADVQARNEELAAALERAGQVLAEHDSQRPTQCGMEFPLTIDLIDAALSSSPASALARREAVERLEKAARVLMSMVYPPDVFTGESGDPGAVAARNVNDALAELASLRDGGGR